METEDVFTVAVVLFFGAVISIIVWFGVVAAHEATICAKKGGVMVKTAHGEICAQLKEIK